MSENVINCPHCGKPVLTPKGVDEEKLRQVVGEQMGDFCARFPELCQQVSGLQKKVGKIEEAVTQHPIPSESLLDLWRQCDDCRPKAEKLGILKPIEEEQVSSFPWIKD